MYTKGNWYAKQFEGCGGLNSNNWQVLSKENETIHLVAVAYGSKRPSEAEFRAEQKANAQLIAASPDLLEACKWGANSDHHPHCSLRKNGIRCNCHVGACQAAIAKAKGDS